VKLCVEKNYELEDLTLEELRDLNPAFDESFRDCLKPAAVLAIHDVVGGTAPARVQKAIVAAKKKIQGLREEVHAHA
jgi:argininosuccinate lyase